MISKYIEYVEQLLDIAEKNDIFYLTSREFADFALWVEWSLERQLPRKVDTKIIKTGEVQHICQSCWEGVGYRYAHCQNCGQVLDWSEE